MFRKQVYTSDVDPKTVEGALTITYTQSKKVRYNHYHCYDTQSALQLLEEFGLDFRFLLEELLVEKPKEAARSRPVPARVDPELMFSPPITPSPTPVRSRSPAVPTRQNTIDSDSLSTPTDVEPSRSSTPASFTIDALLSESGISSPPAPTPRTVVPRHNAVESLRARSNASLRESVVSITSLQRQAPPPRSRDRPGSSSAHRPPPVAVPPRTGMI